MIQNDPALDGRAEGSWLERAEDGGLEFQLRVRAQCGWIFTQVVLGVFGDPIGGDQVVGALGVNRTAGGGEEIFSAAIGEGSREALVGAGE
jgi:hypothetical protein